MKVAESRQQITRIAQKTIKGTTSHSIPITPTRILPMDVAASQPHCIRPLYLGGDTFETNEIPIGLKNNSAMVNIK